MTELRAFEHSGLIRHSGLVIRHSSRAFTLIEMLTTIAALVILLGLMVSLARDVRSRSASALTAEILSRLERLMAEYQHETGQLPAVSSIVPGRAGASEESVNDLARINNQEFVVALRSRVAMMHEFRQFQPAVYGQTFVNDAWGDPIVFMPQSNSSIGLSPGNRFFFFSAGPDRRYLSRDDNLYSYDQPGGGQSE
ncbi:MAG TPA: prepilin-type N-terminal cleavage/methylation domain-containing protein [Tepidisphaeraceae bacterium]|nr:prepilin-type N-terminal cleavage/methylation domain-containing protein [Tepidisphaeraceae bacterium]